MDSYFINELINKTGTRDKFELTRLAIRKARQLIKQKNKKALLDSKKITHYTLEELQKGQEQPDKELLPEKQKQSPSPEQTQEKEEVE